MENKNVTDAVKDAYRKLMSSNTNLKNADAVVCRAQDSLTTALKCQKEATSAQRASYSSFSQASTDWVMYQLNPDEPPF